MKIVKVEKSIEHSGYVIYSDGEAVGVADLELFKDDADFLKQLEAGDILETLKNSDMVIRMLSMSDEIYPGIRGELESFTDLTTIYEAK